MLVGQLRFDERTHLPSPVFAPAGIYLFCQISGIIAPQGHPHQVVETLPFEGQFQSPFVHQHVLYLFHLVLERVGHPFGRHGEGVMLVELRPTGTARVQSHGIDVRSFGVQASYDIAVFGKTETLHESAVFQRGTIREYTGTHDGIIHAISQNLVCETRITGTVQGFGHPQVYHGTAINAHVGR